MKKKIKHVSELPDWFDIKKYHNNTKLTLSTWGEQLHGRIHFRDSILRAKELELEEDSPEGIKYE
jgi:hypothetical protein